MGERGAWAPDPTGSHQYRWWNGSEWTEHVADAGVASTDPMPATPPGDTPRAGEEAITQEAAAPRRGDEAISDRDADRPDVGDDAPDAHDREDRVPDDEIGELEPVAGDPGASWWARHQSAVVAGALAGLVGIALGALIVWGGLQGDLDDERATTAELQDELDERTEELDATADELEELRDALRDRAEQRRADEAEAARIEAEREEQEREEAAAAERAAREQADAEAEAAAARREITRDGTFEVGRDVDPGRWRTDGGGACYWAILSEPTGELGSIITNSFGGGPQIVDLAEGRYFETNGCGTWRID